MLTFPPWDPENEPAKQESYIKGNPVCESELALSKEETVCEFNDDKLILSKGVVSRITRGSTVSFKVSGYNNPIQSGPIYGFEIFTAIEGCGY